MKSAALLGKQACAHGAGKRHGESARANCRRKGGRSLTGQLVRVVEKAGMGTGAPSRAPSSKAMPLRG